METSGAIWRTSSHSTQDGNCVEVAAALPGRIAVRDSKDPLGAPLLLAAEQWQQFTHQIKAARPRKT
jgi:Domain of unknown function (DUF397)